MLKTNSSGQMLYWCHKKKNRGRKGGLSCGSSCAEGRGGAGVGPRKGEWDVGTREEDAERGPAGEQAAS